MVNLSVAAGVYESYDTDPLTLAARRAVEAGIVVVTAAGNFGRNAKGQPQYGGITSPGNAPWVLTVGASSHKGTIDANRRSKSRAFSSRGPSYIDYAGQAGSRRAGRRDRIADRRFEPALCNPSSGAALGHASTRRRSRI